MELRKNQGFQMCRMQQFATISGQSFYIYTYFFWPRFRMQRFTLRCFIYATFSHLFALFSVFRFLDLNNMLKMMRISFKKKGLYKGV